MFPLAFKPMEKWKIKSIFVKYSKVSNLLQQTYSILVQYYLFCFFIHLICFLSLLFRRILYLG